MSSYSVSQLSDHALLRDLAASVRQDRATTATMLAQIAEVDYRKLYRPAAYESMYLYCVHELRMSEETAYRRIRVARTAQKFPAIFDALADGRLHLTAVVLLAPHLKSENSDDLLAMATRKTGHEIEGLLAVRFPKPDVPTFVRPIAATTITPSLAALPVPVPDSQLPPAPGIASVDPVVSPRTEPLAPAPVVPSVPSNSAVHTEPVPSRTKLAPLSPGRFALQVTVDQETHDLLHAVQSLLGHAVPSGDVAEVLKRSLREMKHRLEKQRFAKSGKARPRRSATKGRYIPADIRRTVWDRDGGQCTFVSDNGKRCDSRKRLEYDHIEAVARGGQTTVNGIRLLCRAHNQLTAECTFGAGFMQGKRELSKCRAARAKAQADAQPQVVSCPG